MNLLEVGDKVRVFSQEKIAEAAKAGVNCYGLQKAYNLPYEEEFLIKEIYNADGLIGYNLNTPNSYIYPEEVLELV